jgi:hypothetical protein
MFISFAPPKEMNQRKGGRKRQPVPLAALRVGTGSHLFRLSIAQKSFMEISCSILLPEYLY